VHKHRLIEIQEFFETYKRLEPHKWVKVRDWKNAQQAREIVTYAMQKYIELGNQTPESHK
jgi:inorganic pyrophosphatase